MSRRFGGRQGSWLDAGGLASRPTRSKYGNRHIYHCDACGHYTLRQVPGCPMCGQPLFRFDSRAEHQRWLQLQLRERTGQIDGLSRQRPFELMVNGHKVGTYRADFCYRERGRLVVEDVKGAETPVYKLKAKLMLAIHGIEIVTIK